MYFPALKNSIQNLDEKKFYNIALMYLENIGYKDLSIVDGPKDGGVDVICSRSDLRIQLSVRRDWEKKINEEAFKTKSSNLRHLIYITNKIISPVSETEFREATFIEKGDIEVSIHDLRKISTALARPGVIRKAYEMLEMAPPTNFSASPHEIALSSVLLFSQESRELKEEIVSSALRATVLKYPAINESELIHKISSWLPGENLERAARAALVKLRVKGRIIIKSNRVDLSDAERSLMLGAETEYLAARQADISMLCDASGLDSIESSKLLDMALELITRNQDLNGLGPAEEALRAFIANKNLSRRREKIYDALSKTSLSEIKQFGATVNQVFSTNTFDIYRALGQRTDIALVLDASVAMPVIFGLTFGTARSRYGVAATALKDVCKAHSIPMVVPKAYLNEMAAHGREALKFLEVYGELPLEARAVLRSSGNAYLNHFTHIAESTVTQEDKLELKTFLEYFGLHKNRSLDRVENRLQTILEQFGFNIIPDGLYDRNVRQLIAQAKPHDPRVIVDHDAIVCTMLKNESARGYILATWDKTMVELVEDLARVFADTPARVIDMLSMATGQSFESNKNYEMFTALLHADEKIAEGLANKIQKISTTEQAYRLEELIRTSRGHKGHNWTPSQEDLEHFVNDIIEVNKAD